MKTLIIITSIFLLSCSDRKFTSTKDAFAENTILTSKDTFDIQCDIPNINNIISYCDTTIDNENYKGHVMKCFDSYRHLLKVDSSNLYESNMNKLYAFTKMYDTSGNLLYESIAHGLIKFHCYSYNYDNNGHLLEKTGYSSGELGVKVTYIYQGDKLVEEITERPGQKTEKVY